MLGEILNQVNMIYECKNNTERDHMMVSNDPGMLLVAEATNPFKVKKKKNLLSSLGVAS